MEMVHDEGRVHVERMRWRGSPSLEETATGRAREIISLAHETMVHTMRKNW